MLSLLYHIVEWQYSWDIIYEIIFPKNVYIGIHMLYKYVS